jgi:hypothetical protein
MSDEIRKKRTKAESQIIINEVVKEILKGKHYKEILGFLKEKYEMKFKTSQWYYEKANKEIIKISEQDCKSIYEKQLSRYNQRLYRCSQIENPKDRIMTELKVMERIDKINGLEKLNIDITTDVNVVIGLEEDKE